METILESHERGDIFVQIGAPFWALHRGLQIRDSLPLSRGTSVSYPGTCNTTGAMVKGIISDARENVRNHTGQQVEGYLANEWGL